MAKVIFSSEEQKYLADSEYLQREVRKLEGEKSRLINEQNSLIKKVSDLKEEQFAVENKAKDIIAQAVIEAKQKMGRAQEIENKAIQERSIVQQKIAELADTQNQAKDIIKSNEGKSKNLDILQKETENLKNRLITIMNMIKKETGF